ncbi:hypothetical protein BHM03_00033882 [Ensete ventricosum]|nr:hypothetical protein BHM03_00033882 [Ensete ventricosum]
MKAYRGCRASHNLALVVVLEIHVRHPVGGDARRLASDRSGFSPPFPVTAAPPSRACAEELRMATTSHSYSCTAVRRNG